MRKYKLISIVGLIVIAVLATSVYSVIEHRQQVEAQAADVSGQEKAKQLAEWQQKVKAWEQQEAQKKMTASQSDLESQGVSTLPDTGPGHTFALVLLVTSLSTISYLFITKFIFKRYI